MDRLLTFLVSIFEWIALLSFPLILLGYHYRRYINSVIILSGIMSLVSILLHASVKNLSILIILQMIILLFFVRFLFRANIIETFVISSVGYGFYILIQSVVVEITIPMLGHKYYQLFESINLKFTLQILTFIFVALLCYFMQRYNYQLDELRIQIKAKSIQKKYKLIMMINSMLTFLIVSLIIFIVLAEEMTYKYVLSLVIIVVLFIILSIFIVIHTQIQQKRLIEAKKYYLDQEEQVATIVENLKKNYQGHFQAIIKLNERESSSLSKEYVEKHHLHQGICPSLLQSNLRTGLEGLDELLYSFLINKRKLGRLLGVTINVTSDIQCEIHTTLQHVRNLSLIIDDLIMIYYQAPAYSTKTIHFHVEAKPHETLYVISGDIEIEEKKHPNLKLFDALFQFKQHDSIVDSELKPVRLSIRCPLT